MDRGAGKDITPKRCTSAGVSLRGGVGLFEGVDGGVETKGAGDILNDFGRLFLYFLLHSLCSSTTFSS